MANKKKRGSSVRGLMGVRFSAEERAGIERAAERDGISPSTFVRIAAVRAARGESAK